MNLVHVVTGAVWRAFRHNAFRYGGSWLASVILLASVVSNPSIAQAKPQSKEITQRHRSASAASCPWAQAAGQAHLSPDQLAKEVLAHMDLAEKVEFVVLRSSGPYENVNTAIPSLCLPQLVLSDGPNGIAYRTRGVTQLPASLGVAASFDPNLAYNYGKVLGQEALGKGIDVVQGPNLNLVRVPEAGRAFEGYGEDPYLASVMGVADIRGIQSTGALADAKHFTAYNQETARSLLDEEVNLRTLEELYLRPFHAAVEAGHVASIMCAYGAIDGINDCSDPLLYKILYRQWHFGGFVRSDLAAVRDPVAAFEAGLSMIKPGDPDDLREAVVDHKLPISALNRAVERVLAEMFAFHLIGRPPEGNPRANVATKAHALFALQAAEESIVLLKNDGILPLSRSDAPVAVIGTDAGHFAATAGHGSAHVLAPFVITPLGSITRYLDPPGKVIYAPGGPPLGRLDPIPIADFTEGEPLPFRRAVRFYKAPSTDHEEGKSDIRIAATPGLTEALVTADTPGSTRQGWMKWVATIVPKQSGLYNIAITENGDCWFSIDGHVLFASRGVHGRNTWDVSARLTANRPYVFELDWYPVGIFNPTLGWSYVTPYIEQAVAAAKRAKVAVVFVNDYNSEGFDRPNLDLPGYENQLVSAVAQANPHTVVVLNTGGAVLMPWLSRVAAVLEAWYPGEEDGAAITAVLFGKVDPAGKLPISFPRSNSELPTSTPEQWPGVDGVVHYTEGLLIGYRWYLAKHKQPLFPFGFGLSYTTFSLGRPKLVSSSGVDKIQLELTNTGRRQGADVVECYLAFPASAGEPPWQLVSFARVSLQPGETRPVYLDLRRSAFEAFLKGSWKIPAGRFVAAIGTSSENLIYKLAVPVPTSP